MKTDDGFITPLIPFLAVAMLLLGGLVVDGSRQLNARGRAVAYAEEAARAGASAVPPGELALDEDLARQRVQDYCGALLADPDQDAGLPDGSCAFQSIDQVSGGDPRQLVVRVRVSLQVPATLLGLVGVQTLNASGEARARPYEGVDAGDVDSDPPPVLVPPPSTPPDGAPITLPPPMPDPCDLDGNGVADIPQPPGCPGMPQ